MNSPRNVVFRVLSATLLVVTLAVGGCVGWPVQEFSDARQAISAAQKAGADKHAPVELAEARKLLANAKASANRGDYRTARDEAGQAREKAIEARQTAEKATAPPRTPEPAATHDPGTNL